MNSLGFFSMLLSIFLSVTVCNGAPTTYHSFERRFSGKATWFVPDTGACGDKNVDSDAIVAMNRAQYQGSCHKTVSITNTQNGKSATAKVTDECPSCGYGSLDLTSSVFKSLGSLDAGVLPISWEYV